MSMGAGSDMYRQQIMDHYRNPRSYGRLESPTFARIGENPLCGDTITMGVQLADDGGTIECVAFFSDSCAINQAPTSMSTQRLPSTMLSELEAMDIDDVTKMLGVGTSSTRIRCAALAQQVVQDGAKTHDGEVEIERMKTEGGDDQAGFSRQWHSELNTIRVIFRPSSR